jgi:dihydrofolate reductase
MNITLDGFMSGPDRNLDWHSDHWTCEMAETLGEQLSRADTIILGRVTYEAMAAYWPFRTMGISLPREDIAYAEMMNTHKKIVFSKTLSRAGWNNAAVATGSISTEINRLKMSTGRDMIVYGSGQLVRKLIALGLIDEYHLWVHPVVLVTGRLLFTKPIEKLNMKLFNTRTFDSGVVILYYRPLNIES